MKPLIGIPCWQEKRSEELRSRYTIYQTYVRAVAAGGGAPVILPLDLDPETNQAIFERMDGILLAGGDDVAPARYGQETHPKTEVPDEARDELEINLTGWALARRIPLMAICRGIQVLNVAAGGTLIQDIQEQVPGALQHSYDWDSPELRNKTTHKVSIDPDSHLAKVLGPEAGVNSFHHQALADIPEGFQIVACAQDGIIEAVESKGPGFVLGVQWHPEDMFETDGQMLNLFKLFVANIS